MATSDTFVTPPPPKPHQYPCLFPIKVMGTRWMVSLHPPCRWLWWRHDQIQTLTRHAWVRGRGGNYLSVTLTVTATSREQLDNLYPHSPAALWVKVVL